MKLADWLSENSIRPTEFAARLGVPVSTVTRWARDERMPRLDAVARIQELTNGEVTAVDFLPPSRPPFPADGDAA